MAFQAYGQEVEAFVCFVWSLTQHSLAVNSRGHGGSLKQPYKGEYFVVITLPISPYRNISCVNILKVKHFKCKL